MANSSRIFRDTDTWRKIGYIEYGDSRNFREVLESNPAWDIGFHPAEGDIIFINNNAGEESIGRLETIPLTDFAGASNPVENNSFYPWSSPENLYKRLNQYTEYALENTDELNGFKS